MIKRKGNVIELFVGIVDKVKRMMGWCPNANMDRKITMHREIEIPEMDFNSRPPLFSPILPKNAYVMGITKETVIGVSIVLILILSYFLRFSFFFESYSIYLILLSVVLLQLIVSKAGIEISDRSISVKTILSPFMGSTTHALTSVDSVEVRKNKVSRLACCFLFILGILWLFTFFLHLMEGAPRVEIIQSLIWIIVSFGFGYQMYSASKSVSNIRIRFLPHPSVNKITIHTTNAGQIADFIEKARNRNP
ncbi:MAG: hypothetical protein WA130_21715 [Candidatus Methanoperedens sp.]